jgi:phosphoserine aminotransferase
MIVIDNHRISMIDKPCEAICMVKRAYNFYAGPATLPLDALKRAQAELLDFENTGVSILEISHRSKQYDTMHNEACDLVKELMGIPDDYKVMWVGGGASSQFYMVPMNIGIPGKTMEYVHTGTWSKKAIAEAKLFGDVNVVASSEDDGFSYIPKNVQFSEDAAYAHITGNNTINGTEWMTWPDTPDNVPLICDMSSNLMNRVIDVKKFGVIYAGAQKNLGPAGVTMIIAREDLIERAPKNIPTMIQWRTHASKNSLFNTPPVFPIYMSKLALDYLKSIGGIPEIERRNREKAKLIYDLIDNSGGYYKGHAKEDSRSLMNVTFNLPTPELENQCFQEATARNLLGLKGHRSVGGMRASIYNAMTIEGVRELCSFLTEFQANNQ